MSLPPDNAAEFEQASADDSLSRSRLKLDLITSYALSAARVGSNLAIFAILYRYTNERYAATYAVIRSMLMLLTYVFGGFNPALQRLLAAPFAAAAKTEPLSAPVGVLPYASQREWKRIVRDEADVIYAHANLIASSLVLLLIIPVTLYGELVNQIHDFSITRSSDARPFALAFGIALLFRLWSEPSSAILQLRNRLGLDNLVQIAGEVIWIVLCLLAAVNYPVHRSYGGLFAGIASLYLLVSVAVLCVRRFLAAQTLGFCFEPFLDLRWSTLKTLVAGSTVISLGQFADFLYAPANILLINTFVHPSAVARYAPALQIDAGLLLLVGAVSSVMLPRAMAAWARGDRELLRSVYLRSTLACLLVLIGAAVFVGALIERILNLWLGTVPPDAPMITRLVLIHTVVGGTAGVGRAVLLGMGRFKAYTISALLGGIANVALALLFVLVFHWGLRGIVLATIISVIVRCALWMPLYILRALRGSTTSNPVSRATTIDTIPS